MMGVLCTNVPLALLSCDYQARQTGHDLPAMHPGGVIPGSYPDRELTDTRTDN
jgi:hypothetical protein